jgi:hypothetical protein
VVGAVSVDGGEHNFLRLIFQEVPAVLHGDAYEGLDSSAHRQRIGLGVEFLADVWPNCL